MPICLQEYPRNYNTSGGAGQTYYNNYNTSGGPALQNDSNYNSSGGPILQNDSYCKPGVLYQVPPLQADFTLDVSGPAGTDKIRAIASSAPIAAESLHFTQNGDFDESKMAKFPVRASADIVIH